MEYPGMIFGGPPVDDAELLDALPRELRSLLELVNGFVAFDGGLHIRGVCESPSWHSLRRRWQGEFALHERYPVLTDTDIPFAEDAVGDQWLLRAGGVVRLAAEMGDLEDLDQPLDEFLTAVLRDPMETLGLHPLLQFKREGGSLAPGQLLSVYPPFCTKEAARGVSLAAIPTDERLDFLAELARQLPPSGPFRVQISE